VANLENRQPSNFYPNV